MIQLVLSLPAESIAMAVKKLGAVTLSSYLLKALVQMNSRPATGTELTSPTWMIQLPPRSDVSEGDGG
jgi:hypothetical protein